MTQGATGATTHHVSNFSPKNLCVATWDTAEAARTSRYRMPRSKMERVTKEKKGTVIWRAKEKLR